MNGNVIAISVKKMRNSEQDEKVYKKITVVTMS